MTGSDSAGVKVPPPAIFLLCLAAGYALHRGAPWLIPFDAPLGIAGGLCLVASLALAAWAFPQFGRYQTDVRPDRPTSSIIRDGPYRYTRNPLYLALGLLSLGVALVVGSGWMVLAVAIALAIVRIYVIRREESYLEAKFGAEYLEYKRSVRRWI